MEKNGTDAAKCMYHSPHWHSMNHWHGQWEHALRKCYCLIPYLFPGYLLWSPWKLKINVSDVQHWKVVHFHFSVEPVILFRTKLIRHKWFSINLILPIVYQVIQVLIYCSVLMFLIAFLYINHSLKYYNSYYLYIISMSTFLLH